MSFNIGQFISSKGKSLVDSALATGTDKLLSAVSSKLSRALMGGGNSFQTIASIASSKLDGLIEKTSNEFFNTGAGVVGRNPQTKNNAVTTPVADVVAGNKSSAEILKYPVDLGENYYFSLNFMKYKRPSPMLPSTEESTLFVHLPIPAQLQQSHSITYNKDGVGIFGTIADAIDAAANQNKSLEDQTSAAMAVNNRLLALTASKLIGDGASNVLSQELGAAFNPNLATTFEGPTLRSFDFSWEFSPNSPQESRRIKKIINEMRARALPSVTYLDSTSILSYPQMVQISINPKVGDYKRAMIQGINTNYAVAGAPVFFKDTREPTFISLTLSFVEIEVFLSSDFGGKNGQGFNDDLANKGSSIGKQLADALGINGANPKPPGAN